MTQHNTCSTKVWHFNRADASHRYVGGEMLSSIASESILEQDDAIITLREYINLQHPNIYLQRGCSFVVEQKGRYIILVVDAGSGNRMALRYHFYEEEKDRCFVSEKVAYLVWWNGVYDIENLLRKEEEYVEEENEYLAAYNNV
ncbi:pamO [Acrasis kona]|uniref:PamO n=1 Tax=Acrasis kona TaxID=1008807 RepID=A0AAW2ZLX9_9EUKA